MLLCLPLLRIAVVWLQSELQVSMNNNGLWTDSWATVWALQPQLASVFNSAIPPGGMQVNSVQYLRSRTRNGSRVLVYYATSGDNLRPYAAEVQRFIKLRQPAAGCSSSNIDGGGSAAGGSSGDEQFAMFAAVKCYNTKTPRDEPDLAELLLEARADEFLQQGRLWAVPLDLIHCPLHTNERTTGGVRWLMMVPVSNRSKRAGFRV